MYLIAFIGLSIMSCLMHYFFDHNMVAAFGQVYDYAIVFITLIVLKLIDNYMEK